ncbi:efflux RND transporter permease subunit [Rubrimonas cliftonensis]|uniref:Multidrug efflux pump subunit AcrB n=1 Tax=Rubrimonas cliftonensis TaxID=89524 RepID=A0A1H3VFC4_9RHOB|nr:efflux RND transporter permease subunit [Rubrimonas cliftonensis]SDZ73449.1 Multidrug efflux pump subunit AcrB [Rubrimonas cliftonensis]
MSGLISYFIRHRTAAGLVAALMLLAGFWAAGSLRQQFFPDIVIEQIRVDVAWPGASPEDVDRQITARLEPALRAMEGVEGVSARSTEGAASIGVSFEPGHDMARAFSDALGVVSAESGGLPDSAERPQVRQTTFRDRVTDVALWGPVDRETLVRLAQELQARLYAAGVTRVALRGAPEPEIVVAAREIDLVRHDIELQEIAARIREAASATPAGEVGEGGARVRAGADARSAEAVAAIALRREPGGGALAVRDLADVRLDADGDGASYGVGGAPAVILAVDRGEDGDAVAIQNAVARAADALRQDLPAGVEIALTRTRAQAITDRLDLLIWNGAIGLALVLGLLFLFLSARAALWVAFGIPVAVAAALALMWAAGLTLNMISLFALILCLGVVVDDAIVVAEHADHLGARGMAPEAAAQAAAERMLMPVFAASLTTVIAFLGLVAIGGRFGSLILAIPLTVTMVLVASLIECFLILPGHMRQALAGGRRGGWADAPARLVDRGFRRARERLFRPLLTAAVRWRWVVIGGAAALLMASATLLTSGAVSWRFFDAPERSSGSLDFAMLPTAGRGDTEAMLAETLRALEAVSPRFATADGAPPVVFALGVSGGSAGRGLAGAEGRDAELLGGVSIEVVEPERRDWTVSAFLRAWREEIRPHPLTETVAGRGDAAGPGGDALSIDLVGDDPRVLKAAAEALKAALARLEPVSAVEDDLPFDREELTIGTTPRGAALGFDAESLGAALRARLTGIEAAEFPIEGRTATVTVRLADAERTADFIDRAALRAPDGGWAALGDIAAVSRGSGFATITRRDGYPVLTVSGEIDGTDPAAAAAAVAEIEGRIMPDIAARFAVDWRVGGLREQEQRFLADARVGFLACLAGIYATLAWAFGSWSRPLPVLIAIPLGLIGVLWGHHLMGAPLSMFSVVGLLGMAGIVINDSIVLVRAADEHAARRGLAPALVEAGCDRLRAVFLTTATTVAGLAPMLFETSTQAQFLKPTVITLAFGLGFGMVLVLVVTPALLAAQGDLAALWRSTRRLPRALARARRMRARAAA